MEYAGTSHARRVTARYSYPPSRSLSRSVKPWNWLFLEIQPSEVPKYRFGSFLSPSAECAERAMLIVGLRVSIAVESAVSTSRP